VGWVIDPDGRILGCTTAKAPFTSVDIDLDSAALAHRRHPCNVFHRDAA
jgi:hypothetical protein